jgi:membrane protease YdiL (CAAX protease family)
MTSPDQTPDPTGQDGGQPPAPEPPPDEPPSRPPPRRDSVDPPEPSRSSGPPPMGAVAATGWSLGITFLFFVLAVALAKARPGSERDVVSGVSCQAIAYLVGLFLILRVHAPEAGIRDFLGVRPTHWLFYPLGILLGVALEVPANALYNYVERVTGDQAKDGITEIFQAASNPRRALIALVVILFGPVLEEILFRGALFRPMLKVHPVSMVILVTATLFAIAHPSYQMYLPIGLVGIALGVLRYASGSLIPSILLHTTFNAIPFYAMAAHTAGAPETDEAMPLWIVGVSVVLVLLLLGCAHLLGARTLDARLSREYDKQ